MPPGGLCPSNPSWDLTQTDQKDPYGSPWDSHSAHAGASKVASTSLKYPTHLLSWPCGCQCRAGLQGRVKVFPPFLSLIKLKKMGGIFEWCLLAPACAECGSRAATVGVILVGASVRVGSHKGFEGNSPLGGI